MIPCPPGPDTLLLLGASGLGGIYYELIRPRLVLPGVGGLALTSASVYLLSRNTPSLLGVSLLAASAIFFVIEMFCPVRFAGGLLATSFLLIGLAKLFPAPPKLDTVISVPVACLTGAATMVLANQFRRARSNKRRDLKPNARLKEH